VRTPREFVIFDLIQQKPQEPSSWSISLSEIRAILGFTPKLSLLHCSSSICNMLCVEVLLILF